MTKQKPKSSRTSGIKHVGGAMDEAWTPWHGAAPLFPYLGALADRLGRPLRIWEPMAGAGWLALWFMEQGHEVIQTDVETGHNFLLDPPLATDAYDVIVTNPAFSIKYTTIEQCYRLRKPWALLMPVDTAAAEQARVASAPYGGMQELRLTKRINFHMPGSGFHNSGAQMTTWWFCHQLLPQQIVSATLPEPRPEHRLYKPTKAQAKAARITKYIKQLRDLADELERLQGAA